MRTARAELLFRQSKPIALSSLILSQTGRLQMIPQEGW